ncbi:MAG: HD domain-containing protein [Desulfovibrionaceae bacterium]
MTIGKPSPIPENISEEYYQISDEMLSSFPKYRPPVDLFRFRETILTLSPFSRKGQRLTNEQVEEVQQLCGEGCLFVSRSDHPIYSEHIVKQLDLALQDSNLKETELIDICIRALLMRFENFVQQPVRIVFDPLFQDVMVLTEILWQDKHRIKILMRRLLTTTHTLANHSLNTMAVGLWLWMNSTSSYRRRDLDRTTLALFLHDIGMIKVPQFIVSRAGALKMEEKEKINAHPFVGYKLLQKMDVVFDEMSAAVVQHHERLDGSGYPQHLKCDTIHRIGRLTAVADAFAAMIATHPYGKAKDMLQAAQELAQDRNRFDPQFTGKLLTALQTNTFGDMTNINLPDAGQEPDEPEQALE